ncbi:hypothetical protein B0H14DRAFT_2568301 [Mycena olivaceomarginata]|nr:hypothetical protein B0H14DRAFT_2568301 [Mycena olivaceomarginata]
MAMILAVPKSCDVFNAVQSKVLLAILTNSSLTSPTRCTGSETHVLKKDFRDTTHVYRVHDYSDYDESRLERGAEVGAVTHGFEDLLQQGSRCAFPRRHRGRWPLNASILLTEIGDETGINYRERRSYFMQRIVEAIASKKAWVLDLVAYWDCVLFPDADAPQPTSAGDQRLEDAEATKTFSTPHQRSNLQRDRFVPPPLRVVLRRTEMTLRAHLDPLAAIILNSAADRVASHSPGELNEMVQAPVINTVSVQQWQNLSLTALHFKINRLWQFD